MSLRINTNIFSMIVSRNLEKSTAALEQSYERLSSGYAINKASDDPSGLATSELLRYESSGLTQAQQNVSTAFSMVGTSESYLDNISELLNQARELLVEAGNETLSAANRSAIQDELDQINEQIQQVASTSQYNDLNLLDGSLTGVSIQTGTSSTSTISFSLPDFQIATLGSIASLSGSVPVSNTVLNDGDVTINGVSVGATSSDGVSTAYADASALAKAEAINAIEAQTGVHAEAEAAVVTGVGSISAVSIDGSTNSLTINGVSIGPVSVSADDSSGALVDAINAQTNSTGVTASLDDSGQLVLESEDGRNIEVVTTGNLGATLGLTASGDINEVAFGSLTLTSVEDFTLNDTAGDLGFGAGAMSVAIDTSTSIASISAATAEDAMAALDSIDAALAQVSESRSKAGAVYNRLETLIDSLATQIENISTADSVIRDADVALETARYTQAEILQEAAIAMLTQANTIQRTALELLQL